MFSNMKQTAVFLMHLLSFSKSVMKPVQADSVVNAKEYKALCRLYNIAMEGQELKNAGYLRDSSSSQVRSDSGDRLADYLALLNFSGPSKEVALEGGRKVTLRRSRTHGLAFAKLETIAAAVAVARNDGESHRSQADLKIKEAVNDFREAAYGEWATQTTKGVPAALATDRNADCAIQGSGKGGKAIVFDLLCLCAPSHSSSLFTCGPKLTDSTGWTSSNGQSHFQAQAAGQWQAMEPKCRSTKADVQLTPEFINNSLIIFEDLIGGQASEDSTNSNGRAQHLFGKPHSSAACSHSGTANIGCIDYGNGGNPVVRGPIAWEQKIQEAAKKINEARKEMRLAKEREDRVEKLTEIGTIIFNETILEAQMTEELSGSATDQNNGQKKQVDKDEPLNKNAPLVSTGGAKHATARKFLLLSTLLA